MVASISRLRGGLGRRVFATVRAVGCPLAAPSARAGEGHYRRRRTREPDHRSCATMNDCVRVIRHCDSAWHDRFFDFIALIFGGRTFFDWGARGGWVDGYDVFAMVVDDRIVGTVGRTSMCYRNQWRGAQRLPARRGGNPPRPPQTRAGAAIDEKGFERTRCGGSAGYSLCEFKRARLLSPVRVSQARAKSLHRTCRSASGGHARATSGPRKADGPRVVGRSLRQSRRHRPGLCRARLLSAPAVSFDTSTANGLQAGYDLERS